MARASTNTVQLQGVPLPLDELLRPLVRFATLVVGVIGTAVLAWFQVVLLAPLPLASAFLFYELYFWSRADRPVRFTLDGQELTAIDRSAGRELRVSLHEVEVAAVHHRAADDGQHEAVIVLYGHAGVLFAGRFLVDATTPWHEHDIDVDQLDGLLGGYAGLLRTFAPADARCRQTIVDPDARALRFLRGCLPPETWTRCAARTWRGAAPAYDMFGLHFEAPDGLLIVQHDAWELREGEHTRHGAITLLRAGRADRALLLHAPTADPSEPPREVELPLLCVELHPDLTLTLPAPVAQLSGQRVELRPDLLHTHLPEGAALLWRILHHWPVNTWPAPLRQSARQVPPVPADSPPTTSAT